MLLPFYPPSSSFRLLGVISLRNSWVMSRMGANVLFNERIQTRVLQAIGRCTRSLQDYSAVVVTGDHLPDYLVDRDRRGYFHPELQAELAFGIEQSQDTKISDLVENFKIFLRNDTEWEDANSQILSKRAQVIQKPFPAMNELSTVVEYEIDFQRRMWQGDFVKAIEAAEKVLAGLTASELKGYRALWFYLAGSAAWCGAKNGEHSLIKKSSALFTSAKEAAPTIPWLVSLSKYQNNTQISGQPNNKALLDQIERLEAVLTDLGTTHSRKYDRREKEILEGLKNNDRFEYAHVLLGKMLGFDSNNDETDASPDPWWIAGDFCFVFEDHAGATPSAELDATKARQAASHPNWIEQWVSLSEGTKIIPILVSPVKNAKTGAVPHLKSFSLWPLDDFTTWATNALAVIRELRTKFSVSGDLLWRAEACTAFENARLDANGLYNFLSENKADKILHSNLEDW